MKKHILEQELVLMEKEKRLKTLEKHLTWFERVKREEERPLLKQQYEEQKVEDEEYYRKQMETFLVQHREQHAIDLKEKHRMLRMLEDKAAFEERLMSQRRSHFDLEQRRREERLVEKRAQLLRERERLEREEQERCAEMERRRAELEKQREEMEQRRLEEEKRLQKLREQAEKQRRREEEVMARERNRELDLSNVSLPGSNVPREHFPVSRDHSPPPSLPASADSNVPRYLPPHSVSARNVAVRDRGSRPRDDEISEPSKKGWDRKGDSPLTRDRDRQFSSSGFPLRERSREREFPPKDREFPSKDREFPSREREFPPREREFPPKEREFPSKEREFPPKDREFPPKDREFPPKDREFPPREREFPPKDREFPSREREFPSREREFPPKDREFPSKDRELPSKERNFPRSGFTDVGQQSRWASNDARNRLSKSLRTVGDSFEHLGPNKDEFNREVPKDLEENRSWRREESAQRTPTTIEKTSTLSISSTTDVLSPRTSPTATNDNAVATAEESELSVNVVSQSSSQLDNVVLSSARSTTGMIEVSASPSPRKEKPDPFAGTKPREETLKDRKETKSMEPSLSSSRITSTSSSQLQQRSPAVDPQEEDDDGFTTVKRGRKK